MGDSLSGWLSKQLSVAPTWKQQFEQFVHVRGMQRVKEFRKQQHQLLFWSQKPKGLLTCELFSSSDANRKKNYKDSLFAFIYLRSLNKSSNTAVYLVSQDHD